MTRKKSEPFEESLKKLEKIVEKLEHGNLPLEEALDAFTEGMRLARHCQLKLDEVDNSIQMLLKESAAGWATVPFADVPGVAPGEAPAEDRLAGQSGTDPQAE